MALRLRHGWKFCLSLVKYRSDFPAASNTRKHKLNKFIGFGYQITCHNLPTFFFTRENMAPDHPTSRGYLRMIFRYFLWWNKITSPRYQSESHKIGEQSNKSPKYQGRVARMPANLSRLCLRDRMPFS